MKRYGNIFDKICTYENILEAHRNARKGKLHYGEVIMVDADEEYYLNKILCMLRNKTYAVSPYMVEEHIDTGKLRTIHKLPYYPDRIIQWAIMLQVDHIFMKVFTTFTNASLKYRGIHRASQQLSNYMKDRNGTAYCLKIDIAKFYPTIDHEILKNLLRKKFKDADLLELLDRIVDSMEGGEGIPIGSYLSQYLANFYLAYFDHWLKEQVRVKYAIRYMDDIVILGDSKEWLHDLKIKIDEYLETNLKLKLKANWQVFPTAIRGVDFVGYRHFYDYKLLRKSSCKRYKRKMCRIHKKVLAGGLITYHDFCSVNSYKGWLKWCDSYRLTEKYIGPIQEKINEYYFKEVKKAGVKKNANKSQD